MLAALEKREHEIEVSRLALREKERMLTTLMANLDGMVYRCRNDDHWTMEFVSDGCHYLTGYRPEELLHNSRISYKELEHPEDRARVRSEIAAALTESRRFFVEYRIQCLGGEIKWVWERGVGIRDEAGNVVTLEGFVENVTERKLSTQALQQAERSFRSIFENATEGIFQTSADGRYLNVNPALANIYGFATGAELIASIGDIQHQIYTDPARRAEFMGLMREAGVVTNFVSEIRRKNADTAMYKDKAKEFGRNNFQFYSPEMNAVIAERLEMQSALRSAVEHEQFVLLYQPKVDLVSGQIAGMEALLRVKDEQGGLSLPENFILLAEETGLIVQIGEWVMREACTFNKSLQERGLPPMRVAINLS